MKIGFVIPLKAKCVSKDWETVCNNLKLTVDSVLAQTNNQYECIVVGHDQPEFTENSEYLQQRFRFHGIDDPPPPAQGSDVMENQMSFEADRCTKILKGILELHKNHPDIDYWFPLDADDLVRNDFVEHLQRYSRYDAIIMEKGYFYFKRHAIFNTTDEFSAYCGSSAALSSSILNLGNITSYKNFRSIFYGDISHVHMREFLEEKGYTVAIPKERLNVYVRENGENISHNVYTNTIQNIKQGVKKLMYARCVSPELKGRFGL